MSDLEKRFHTSVRPKWNLDSTVLVGISHDVFQEASRSFKYKKRFSSGPRDLILAEVFPGYVSIFEASRGFVFTDLTIQGHFQDISEAKAADQNRR